MFFNFLIRKTYWRGFIFTWCQAGIQTCAPLSLVSLTRSLPWPCMNRWDVFLFRVDTRLLSRDWWSKRVFLSVVCVPQLWSVLRSSALYRVRAVHLYNGPVVRPPRACLTESKSTFKWSDVYSIKLEHCGFPLLILPNVLSQEILRAGFLSWRPRV